ncbi:MAG: hypothetical protein ACOZF0_21665 [Thermodesulfobacteriota bacterium]
MMGELVPVKLYFEDSGEWYSLPEWAEYFITIGKLLAAAPQSESRIVTAIVVPTRAFGAAFVSLGMVVSDAASREKASKAAHFERLFDLPPGSSVIYRPKPGQALKGVLQEPEERGGRLWVRVQVQSKEGGGLTHFVDESKSLQVQPARHSGKLPKKQEGEKVRFANAFADKLLGDADPVQLGLQAKLVCAIIGRKTILEHEIRKTPLAVHVNGDHHADGILQDVLRVNRFVTEAQSHRSALVPVGAKPPSGEVLKNVEMGVVFDGANGFLKWGEMWHNHHQVIILDRTEAYFDDAISAINVRFSQNRVEGEIVLPECDVPPGAEVLTFREAIIK